MLDQQITRDTCEAMDKSDPLAGFRDLFEPPKSDTIYLDANSMGAMPKTVPERLAAFCRDGWVEARRRGWNEFDWLERPRMIGDALAPLMGAKPGEVLACDTTTINLYKMLDLAWRLRRADGVVLSDIGNFPTDLYVAQGLATREGGPALKVAQTRAELIEAITPDVAVVYLSHGDYRTGERWDMAEICAKARAVGALTVWDLSHATGAVPVDLHGAGADFAVGCGYKYLSGGVGCSAYLWVHPDHADRAWPAICGWMGHADVFAFATDYAPLADVGAQAAGTPAVIANEIFWCAAEIWKEVPPQALWAKHEALGTLMMDLLEQRCGQLGVTVNTPRDPAARAGHVGFSHPGAGQVSEALIEAGVVGSFRKPNALRFGLGALYLSYLDIWEAVDRLTRILETERWRDPRFAKVSV